MVHSPILFFFQLYLPNFLGHHTACTMNIKELKTLIKTLTRAWPIIRAANGHGKTAIILHETEEFRIYADYNQLAEGLINYRRDNYTKSNHFPSF